MARPHPGTLFLVQGMGQLKTRALAGWQCLAVSAGYWTTDCLATIHLH